MTSNTDEMGPITLKGGAIRQAPSDNEEVPELAADALLLCPPRDSFGSSPDSDDSHGFGELAPGADP